MTQLLSAVNEVLRAIDPEELLELGAPADEYSSEAQKIASTIGSFEARELTEESVAAVIRDVWLRAFGPLSEEDISKRMPVFRQVANQILTYVQIS